jgi:hypothetical protein
MVMTAAPRSVMICSASRSSLAKCWYGIVWILAGRVCGNHILPKTAMLFLSPSYSHFRFELAITYADANKHKMSQKLPIFRGSQKIFIFQEALI